MPEMVSREETIVDATRRRSSHRTSATPSGTAPSCSTGPLLAALSIFAIGGALSIWEGIQRLLYPDTEVTAVFYEDTAALLGNAIALAGHPRCPRGLCATESGLRRVSSGVMLAAWTCTRTS
jgi:hypothetical protein